MDLSMFGPALIDEDEWREQPVRHRFVHGSFEGTQTRFSLYLPPDELYDGRFIQMLEGGAAGHDRTIEAGGPLMGGAIAHAFALGAYLVESNQGHVADDPSLPKPPVAVSAYLASVAAARFSRDVAQEMYGTVPHHGYLTGVSGGGLRSIVGLERGEGTWDGAVPCAIPHSGMFYALAEHAARTLGAALEGVIDATDVGGHGDPFLGLTTDQADVLADLYRAGFARGAEFTLRPGYFPVGYGLGPLFEHDPGYFEAFWSEPGYLGFDHPDRLEPLVLDVEATVAAVMTPRQLIPPDTPDAVKEYMAAMMGGLDAPVAAMLEGVPEDQHDKLTGATITIKSGAPAGRLLYAANAVGSMVFGAAYATGGPSFDGVNPGDQVTVNNRHSIAFCYAYRHQMTVEEQRFPDYHPEWRHLTVDGEPRYPQRRPAWSLDGTFASAAYLHEFEGKMLLVQNAIDGTNWPSHAHNYVSRVRDSMGEQRAQERLRLYWTDHAVHGPASMYPAGEPPVVVTRAIDYGGLLFQAMADLIAWVERGVEPLSSTEYEWGEDGRLSLAPSASNRGGLQAVPALTANGGDRAEVGVGDEVAFSLSAATPPGVGAVVAVEWDFDGSGAFAVSSPIAEPAAEITTSTTHAFGEPGVYYPAARVWSQRDPAHQGELFRVANLGRVRVVVS